MKVVLGNRLEVLGKEIVKGLWTQIHNKQARFHFIQTLFDLSPSPLVKWAISGEACEEARTILYRNKLKAEKERVEKSSS